MKRGTILFMQKDTKTNKAREIFQKEFGKILKEDLIEKASKITGVSAKSLRIVYDSMEVQLIGEAGERNRLERERKKKEEADLYKGRKRKKFVFDDRKLFEVM